jgi:CRP/FNR family transcriptional regulator, anaerobic regulatory protein
MNETADLVTLARRVRAAAVRLKAGDVVYRSGEPARGWIVLAQGAVRVGLTAENGREILLYRLGPGEACILSTSALLSDETLPAEAVAETDVEAYVVPADRFDRLIAEDADFRRAALRAYAKRVAGLVVMIEDVMFHALPQRLAGWLLARARAGVATATHQEIAAELGTAREVVSRTLSHFERDGLIAADRGQVRLIDPERLAALAR